MLKLYFAPNSSALATHIVLEEADADYETVELDFTKNEQHSPDYLAITPMGRVPALVTDQGVLTETPALLMYVAQNFPAARLAPLDDPFALAKAQEFNSYLCSTVHIAHAHLRRGHRWSDDPVIIEGMAANVPKTVGACFDLIDQTLFKGPWVLGGDYSICDPYLFTVTRWLGVDGVDRKRFPNVDRHFRDMSNREVVKTVLRAHPGTYLDNFTAENED